MLSESVHLLAVLMPLAHETVKLDHFFTAKQTVWFASTGPNAVALTGILETAFAQEEDPMQEMQHNLIAQQLGYGSQVPSEPLTRAQMLQLMGITEEQARQLEMEDSDDEDDSGEGMQMLHGSLDVNDEFALDDGGEEFDMMDDDFDEEALQFDGLEAVVASEEQVAEEPTKKKSKKSKKKEKSAKKEEAKPKAKADKVAEVVADVELRMTANKRLQHAARLLEQLGETAKVGERIVSPGVSSFGLDGPHRGALVPVGTMVRFETNLYHASQKVNRGVPMVHLAASNSLCEARLGLKNLPRVFEKALKGLCRRSIRVIWYARSSLRKTDIQQLSEALHVDFSKVPDTDCDLFLTIRCV